MLVIKSTLTTISNPCKITSHPKSNEKVNRKTVNTVTKKILQLLLNRNILSYPPSIQPKNTAMWPSRRANFSNGDHFDSLSQESMLDTTFIPQANAGEKRKAWFIYVMKCYSSMWRTNPSSAISLFEPKSKTNRQTNPKLIADRIVESSKISDSADKSSKNR